MDSIRRARTRIIAAPVAPVVPDTPRRDTARRDTTRPDTTRPPPPPDTIPPSGGRR
jgi:hypothetical protein